MCLCACLCLYCMGTLTRVYTHLLKGALEVTFPRICLHKYVCFHKLWRSPRTAVLQPSFGSGSPGVWPPSPVLSHFGSTLGVQLLWRNQSTTPKSFRLLKERCGRSLNNGWRIPFPAFLGVGGPEPFHLKDTNEADTKSMNINKSELVGSELLGTMGIPPLPPFPHVSLHKLPNYVAIGRTLSNPLHFT